MAAPITVFVTYRADDPKKTGRVEVEFPSTALSVAASLTQAVAALVDPLINGGILSMGFTVDVPVVSVLNVPKIIPNVLADIRDKATFTFRANGAAGFFPKKITLPTYNEDFTVAGTSLVDQSDADVAAFLDAMTDGIDVSGTLYQPCDGRAYDLDAVISAEEVQRG